MRERREREERCSVKLKKLCASTWIVLIVVCWVNWRHRVIKSDYTSCLLLLVPLPSSFSIKSWIELRRSFLPDMTVSRTGSLTDATSLQEVTFLTLFLSSLPSFPTSGSLPFLPLVPFLPFLLLVPFPFPTLPLPLFSLTKQSNSNSSQLFNSPAVSSFFASLIFDCPSNCVDSLQN